MNRRLDEEIHRSRQLLGNPYAYLDGDGNFDAAPRCREPDVHKVRRVLQNQHAYLGGDGGYTGYGNDNNPPKIRQALISARSLRRGRKRGGRFSQREIESIARNLQIELWRSRESVLPQRNNLGPLEILDPVGAFEALGYSVRLRESLGQYSGDGELFEVAGILDNSSAEVQISRRFSPEIRNFTAAHELGHAILHEGTGLHRDRALDGSRCSGARDPKEIEADIFAAYFLLPDKQVRKAFEHRFLTQHFVLNEATAFALTSGSLDALQNRCRTLRDLTRVLASSEHYNGVHFSSMARQFGVSIEAMAIRLEELILALPN